MAKKVGGDWKKLHGQKFWKYESMEIRRKLAMLSKHTFKIKPIKNLSDSPRNTNLYNKIVRYNSTQLIRCIKEIFVNFQ